MQVSEPTIKEIPEMRVISKRELGRYDETIGKLIGEIFQFIEVSNSARNNIKMTGPCIFICHDEEYKEDDADIEVVFPVSGNISIDDPSINLKTLPAVKVVSAIYKGPYQEVDIAFTKLFEYMGKNGMELAGPSRELFLNDPDEVPEDELLSEVQLPIK
ncbi:heme-binding protein [Methanolobus sp. ZRKC3]|uniref:heme-binding protein n=1 Tax=Methanolobus sp. ZRKC3 TaxID=3125786 RepID=UPI0032562F6C